MPELPEVETTVRGLAKVLEGRRLTGVTARRADLRRSFPAGLGQRLTGARVIGLGRRAKYGMIGTDRGDTLVFHLGMSGHWRIDPDELDRHDHLVIETDEGRRLTLNDARRFGSVDLWPTDALGQLPAFADLGPEPFGLDPGWLKQRLAGRSAPIKAMLLDQRMVAGLGNIYACEALHMAKIHPRRPAGSVSQTRLARLTEAIEAVLDKAIVAGGSSLRDFVSPDGTLGYFSEDFAVYDREGRQCPRGDGMVRRIVLGGRSTFYCPGCQR